MNDLGQRKAGKIVTYLSDRKARVSSAASPVSDAPTTTTRALMTIFGSSISFRARNASANGTPSSRTRALGAFDCSAASGYTICGRRLRQVR